MKNFNKTRFVQVAKWDLAFNRSFYIKSSILIVAVMALPTLFHLWRILASFLYDLPYLGDLSVDSLAWTTILWPIYLFPLLFGYMFHNLRDKQGRIAELTLPATNLEKYLWHFCFIFFGTLILSALCFLLMDLINYLLIGFSFGFHHSQEFISSMGLFEPQDVEMLYEDNLLETLSTLMVILGYVAFVSTFILGNALKYRQNILLTIGFHLVFFFVSLIGSGIFVGLAVDEYSFDHQTLSLSFSDACVCLTILFAIIAVFCIYKSYRLYGRAQITTKRNR